VSHFLGRSEGAEVRDGIPAVSPSRRLVSVLLLLSGAYILLYSTGIVYNIHIILFFFIAPGVRDSTRRQRATSSKHIQIRRRMFISKTAFDPALKHTVLAGEPKTNRTPISKYSPKVTGSKIVRAFYIGTNGTTIII